MGNEYPPGHNHPRHQHRRSQLLFAERGTMLVETDRGAWMVAPSQAIWIPAGTTHGMTMLGHVSTRSVYIAPRAQLRPATTCEVLGVTPLLRELLIAAVDLPTEYDPDSRSDRLMALLMDEIAAAPALPIHLPLPSSPRLAARCRAFLAAATMRETIDDWCSAIAVSRRSFTRTFRRETGLSFAEWQRRACILFAVPRLMQHARVTSVALDLGYANPSAFTTAFQRTMGVPPSSFQPH